MMTIDSLKDFVKNPLSWVFLPFAGVAFAGGKGMSIMLIALTLSLVIWGHASGIKIFSVIPELMKRTLRSPFFYPFLGLIFYAFLSTIWAFNALTAMKTTCKIALCFLMGGFCYHYINGLSKSILQNGIRVLTLCFMILLGLLLIQWCLSEFSFLGESTHDFFKNRVYKIKTSPLFIALFFWPLWAFWDLQNSQISSFKKRSIFLSLVSIILFLGVIYPSSSFCIGFILSIGTYALLRLMPKMFISFVSGIFILGTVFPFILKYILPSENKLWMLTHLLKSWQHRIHIWDFVCTQIMNAPFLGYGMEASRHFPDTDRLIAFYTSHGHTFQSESLIPLHPHQAALQIFLELGVIGLVFTFLIAGLLIIKGKNLFADTKTKACVGASFISTSVPLFVSFGIWQTWWLSTLILLILVWFMVQRIKTFH
jgi:O-antigen ligase